MVEFFQPGVPGEVGSFSESEEQKSRLGLVDLKLDLIASPAVRFQNKDMTDLSGAATAEKSRTEAVLDNVGDYLKENKAIAAFAAVGLTAGALYLGRGRLLGNMAKGPLALGDDLLRSGKSVKLEKLADGRIASTVDSLGGKTVYSYGRGAEMTVSLPSGRQLVTGNGEKWRLFSTESQGPRLIHEYHGTLKVRPDGSRVTDFLEDGGEIVYGINGTVSRNFRSGGSLSRISDGRILETADANGFVTRLGYQSGSQKLDRVVQSDGLGGKVEFLRKDGDTWQKTSGPLWNRRVESWQGEIAVNDITGSLRFKSAAGESLEHALSGEKTFLGAGKEIRVNDRFGRLKEAVDQDSNRYFYEYDQAGQVRRFLVNDMEYTKLGNGSEWRIGSVSQYSLTKPYTRTGDLIIEPNGSAYLRSNF